MSIEKVVMPKLGESVTEGTIVKWMVKAGDKIEQFDTLLEVETAKVVAEVPATVGGIVKEILIPEGETVKVGVQICTIELEGSSTSSTDDNKTVASNTTSSSVNASSNVAKVSSSPIAGITNKDNRYSPAVLSLAQQHGLDLNLITGSGANNRVTRKDILQVIANGGAASLKSTSPVEQINAAPTAANNSVKQNEISNNYSSSNYVQNNAGDKVVPLTAIRKAIANKMVQSVTEIPHAWMSIEVDATNLVKLRDSMKNKFLQNEGFPITYFTFFVHEIVKALKKFPLLNSVWMGDHVLIKKDINISIAVASDTNLFVPVIKNADSKNIKGIAEEIYSLAHKAKSGKLSTSDVEGGTFTINNTGAFGSVKSMGIINHPQAAILQVEAIKKRPVIMDNQYIAVRDMVNLCISIDHRILDGLEVGKFLAEVKNNIENISISTGY